MTIISYSEFVARHANSPKWANLSKAERKARYQQYVQSVANKPSAQQSGADRRAKIKRRITKRQGHLMGSPLAGLSTVSYDYLSVLHNPFLNVPAVGYPMSGNAPSFKYRGFAVGQLVVGANGGACITMAPLICAASDQQGIRYTSSAASTTPANAFFTAATPGTSTAALNVPLASTSTNASQTLIRMVAAGIRIRSSVSLLNKRGEVVSLMMPVSGVEVFGVFYQVALTSYRNFASRHALNVPESPWYSCVWSPSEPPGQLIRTTGNPVASMSADAVYDNLANLAPATFANMGIGIEGGTPGDIYEWEAYGWYEAFGAAALVTGNATMTPSDPTGVALVNSAVTKQALNSMTKNTDGAIPASSTLANLTTALKNMSNIFGSSSSSTATSAASEAGSSSVDDALTDLQARYINLTLPTPPSALESAAPVEEASLGGAADVVEDFLPLLAV